MKVDQKSMNGVELVVVEGRVDSANWEELDKIFGDLLENGRYKIVVDLSGVSVMTSAGLRVLVKALKECRSNSGELKIACPSERMDFTLTMAGFKNVFSVYDEQADAVDSFSGN